MTTSELNIPLSMTLASALVQVGLCADTTAARQLLVDGKANIGTMALSVDASDYRLSSFAGFTIEVGDFSLEVADFDVPAESELDSLRRKFSQLAARLRKPTNPCDERELGFYEASISAADAIEELLSTPYGETK